MNTTPLSLLEQLRRPAPSEAWQRFVRLYTPLLFYWVRRLGLPAQDAADVVQEVFAALVPRLPEFRYDPHRSFRGWLWTVTLNRSEEHTSELQSRVDLVCRLLLEKKQKSKKL